MARLFKDEAFLDTFKWVRPGYRAQLLLAIKSAITQIMDGCKCDFCSNLARMIRFTRVGLNEDHRGYRMPEDGYTVVHSSALCPRCGGLPQEQIKAQLLGRMAEIQRASGGAALPPIRRSVIVGVPVDIARALPDRSALGECESCRRTVRIGRDEHDRIGYLEAQILCLPCVEAMVESGEL